MEFEITRYDAYTIIGYCNNIDEIIEKFPQIETPKANIKCKLSCGTSIFTQKQWKMKERKYTTTYCCTKEDNSILKESILFPPNQNTDIAKLASNIKRLVSNKYNGSAAIITQYNALEHLKFLRYSSEDVGNKLGLSSLSEHWDDSAIVFLNDLNVVINLRYTLADDISDIKQELIKCKEDLLLFLLVNRDSALSSNICFVNVIAAPNFEENGTVFQSENAFNSIIGKSNLENYINFENWWNNIFIPDIQKVGLHETKDSAFMDMISATFTFMATTRIDVPTLVENTDQQIRSILFSNEQLRAINTSANKKIIIGGYGSGKSIVAMGQIQELINKDDNANVKIFYICYDVKTLHMTEMKHFVKSLKIPSNVEVISKNISELCEDLKIFNKVPLISELIPVLVQVQQPGHIVHFVIDEFNCESLDSAEAKALKNLFTTSENLQPSTVVLVAQSMENRRIYNSYDQKTINHESYKYEETGMEVIHLSKCIRNSRSVFMFNNSLQEALSQEKNIFHHPVLPRSSEIKEIADTSRSTDLKENVPTNAAHDSEEVMSARKLLQSIDGNKKQLKAPTTMEDLALSLTPDLCSSTVNTETSYKYQLCDDVWHNIDGSKPVLLAFESKPSHEEEYVTKLAISIEHLCFLKKSHALFLANTRKGRLTLEKVLYCLEKPFILYNSDSDWNIIDSYEKKKLEEMPKECNLITDYQGCRGLQAEQVVVFVDPDDQYHWPYLVESCSRSTNSLVLILIDDLYSPTTNILYRCINKTVENCLVEVDTICDVTNKNKEQPLKVSELLNFKRQLKINTNSHRYCNFVQKILSFKHIKFAKTLEDIPLADLNAL